MSNDERRGGIGFGNQRRVDSGARHQEQAGDDDGESTRAMSVEDIEPAPTEFVRGPAPQRPTGSRPAPRPMARPAPPPPPVSHGEDEEEAATRMLDAMPDDLPPMGRAPSAPGRSLDLKVVSGPDRGKVHPIGEGDSLVGRGLDCQIVLADPAVSRKHFQLRRSGDQVILEDLGGPNGTKLNGEKRARHELEPGDQIEVGMSVMEYQIDGVGKRREARHAAPGDDRPARASEQRSSSRAASGGGGSTKIIVIVAALVLLLVGGGVTAWLVMGKKSSDVPAAAADDDIGALIEQATLQLGDKDYKGAVESLKKAKAVDKTAPEIAPLMRQAAKEAAAQTALEEGRQAIIDEHFDVAVARLSSEEIGKDSVFYADAQTELKVAKVGLIKVKLDEAQKALDGGDTAVADAAIKVVLEQDPDNGPAKMLEGRLAGVAGSAPGADGGVAVPDSGAPAPEEAPKSGAAAKAAEPSRPSEPSRPAEPSRPTEPSRPAESSGSKKADFSAGLSAYASRQWSAAVQAFEAIASGAYTKDEKKKAAGYADAVKRVESAWNKAQGASGKTAGAAWKEARLADSDVDGHHRGFLTEKVMQSYVVAAKSARAAGNCAEAVEHAEVANDFSATGTHPDGKAVIDGCKADGKALLQQAEAALAAGQASKAKDLASKAERILGTDPLAAKAKEVMKKASAAARGDE